MMTQMSHQKLNVEHKQHKTTKCIIIGPYPSVTTFLVYIYFKVYMHVYSQNIYTHEGRPTNISPQIVKRPKGWGLEADVTAPHVGDPIPNR